MARTITLPCLPVTPTLTRATGLPALDRVLHADGRGFVAGALVILLDKTPLALHRAVVVALASHLASVGVRVLLVAPPASLQDRTLCARHREVKTFSGTGGEVVDRMHETRPEVVIVEALHGTAPSHDTDHAAKEYARLHRAVCNAAWGPTAVLAVTRPPQATLLAADATLALLSGELPDDLLLLALKNRYAAVPRRARLLLVRDGAHLDLRESGECG